MILSNVFFKWNDLLVPITFSSFTFVDVASKLAWSYEIPDSLKFLGGLTYLAVGKLGIRYLESALSSGRQRRLGERWAAWRLAHGTPTWTLSRHCLLPSSCWWLWSGNMGPGLPDFLIFFLREARNPNFYMKFLDLKCW